MIESNTPHVKPDRWSFTFNQERTSFGKKMANVTEMQCCIKLTNGWEGNEFINDSNSSRKLTTYHIKNETKMLAIKEHFQSHEPH